MKPVFSIHAREVLKDAITRHPHLLGRRLIEPEEMRARFPDYCVPCAAAVEVDAPAGTAIDGTRVPELERAVRRYGTTAVYRLPREAFQRQDVLESGGVLIDRKWIPHTGVGNQSASILASVKPSFRRARRESCLVAPWPQFMPITYGDFLMHVLPRICRVVNRLTEAERKTAVIAYPLARTTWERDYLGLLGFPPDRTIDTRTTRLEVAPEGVVYAASGEDAGWQERSAHPGDYEAARVAFGRNSPCARTPSRRLYLRRKGRRRLLNEEDVLSTLQPHGFEAIDLEGLSTAGQMALMAEASVLVGVQGANHEQHALVPAGREGHRVLQPRLSARLQLADGAQPGARILLSGRAAAGAVRLFAPELGCARRCRSAGEIPGADGALRMTGVRFRPRPRYPERRRGANGDVFG